MKKPLSIGAFTVPQNPTLPLSEIPITELLESPVSDKSLADELRRLFTQNPATFYHGTSDFYMLKKNTRIPEICILGRSNVGKSTFVNAIANRREKELAHTSSRAGRTKSMNAFGFGPPPTIQELADADPEAKRTEDLPTHQFFVVDMPGYGHRSLQDWGKHISLYLNKRQAVKGAVLLIDGEVGPKGGDLMALELLQSAGVKTAIVLTKADKAVHVGILKKTCQEMWITMRDMHAGDLNSKWEWEKDIFVTALGATKNEIGAETVAIARLAVARLAGLVKEKIRLHAEPAKGYAGNIVSFDDLQFAHAKPSQTPAITQAPTYMNSALTALEQAAIEQHKARMGGRLPVEPKQAPQQSKLVSKPDSRPAAPVVGRLRRSPVRRTTTKVTTRHSKGPTSQGTLTASKTSKSLPGALEQASSRRHRTQSPFSRLSPNVSTNSSNAPNPRQSKAHFIHTSHRPFTQVRNLSTGQGREPPSSKELQQILREFAASLKTNETPRDRAELIRRDRVINPPRKQVWDPTLMPSPKKSKQEKKATQTRHLKIYEARILREEIRTYRDGERKKQQASEEQLAKKHGTKKVNDENDPDALDADGIAHSWHQVAEAQEVRERLLHGKKAKKAKKIEQTALRKEEKQKKQRKEQSSDEDEDDTFAAKFKSAK